MADEIYDSSNVDLEVADTRCSFIVAVELTGVTVWMSYTMMTRREMMTRIRLNR